MKVAVTFPKVKFDKFLKPEAIPEGFEFVFTEGSDLESLKDCLDAEILFVASFQVVDAAVMDSMPNLKMIETEGVGFNAVDVEYAKKKGIYVCNAKAANAAQVAEQTMMLLLNVIHRFQEASDEMKKGNMKECQGRFVQEGIQDIIGKKVGIVGFGAIGKELAKRLKAFGCNLCYYDPFPASPEVEKEFGIERLSFEELLKTSDIVSMHLPLMPETAGIINKDTLAMMKPTAILANTSRGEIVVAQDLADAIRNGVIYGAALDTIAPEPVTADNPLVCLEEPYSYRVAISPHIAGMTLTAFSRMYEIFVENITALKNGEVPKTLVYRL